MYSCAAPRVKFCGAARGRAMAQWAASTDPSERLQVPIYVGSLEGSDDVFRECDDTVT
jgi:hypothetical protein